MPAKALHLLDVDKLTISYRVDKRWLPAVRDFRLQLKAGEIVGLVGESGCGKSTVALALMRYLASNGRVESGGALHFAGEDLLAKSNAGYAPPLGQAHQVRAAECRGCPQPVDQNRTTSPRGAPSRGWHRGSGRL